MTQNPCGALIKLTAKQYEINQLVATASGR